MILLYVIYALVGISIIIFLHEAGHFLAAKKVGVRVDRFAIGFDPPVRGRNLRIFSWKRGETEYVIGLVPFGGYVKLAGEAIGESGKTPAPDELLAKSVGARALVFVAGSAFNIVSGFLFFMLAFTLGVSFPEPRVGAVSPGSPAWTAGVRPGDTVVRVNDEAVLDFTEMRLAIVLAGRNSPMHVGVRRPQAGGEPTDLEFTFIPRWDPEAGFNEIGVTPGYSPTIESIDADGPLARAGLREGDVLRAATISGVTLPDLSPTLLLDALRYFNLVRPLAPLEIAVERDGVRTQIVIEARPKPDAEAKPQLGIIRGLGNIIRNIQPSSDLAGVLLPGDTLNAIDDRAISSFDWVEFLEAPRSPDGLLQLHLRSAAGGERVQVLAHDRFLAANLRGEIYWGTHALRLGPIEEKDPLGAAGFREGDLLVSLGEQACYDLDDLREYAFPPVESAVAAVVERKGARVPLASSEPVVAALKSAAWHTMPILGPPSRKGPAEKAGIEGGSRITRIEGKDVGSWEEMIGLLADHERGDSIRIEWSTPRSEAREATVVLGMDPVESIAFPVELLNRTVKAGPLRSFELGAKRTIVVSKQIFLTLRSLFRRDVSAKNLAGPVGIAHTFTVVIERGRFSMFVYLLALISINLGLFNLLPFPILDGGHLLFLAIEKIKGSPVDIRVQEWATNIAFFLIMALAVFVTFNDVKRLFH